MNEHPWFEVGFVLEGTRTILLPLQESDFDELITVAQEPRIFEWLSFNGSNPERMLRFLKDSLAEKQAGRRMPLVLRLKETGQAIGMSAYYEISVVNRNLEIGWTWIHSDFWGKGLNEEMKQVMLAYCFEKLDLLRVQFKAWNRNVRSCEALTRIGAQYEGTLRNHWIREDGIIRSSAYFSILKEEWPSVNANLSQLIEARKHLAYNSKAL